MSKYVCAVCGRGFPSPQALGGHTSIHGAKAPPRKEVTSEGFAITKNFATEAEAAAFRDGFKIANLLAGLGHIASAGGLEVVVKGKIA